MRISLNIPIYNERNSIEPLYDQLVPVLEGLGCEFEIIITNDGSTDGSNEVVDVLAARDPRVKVLHLRRNYGQTAALMAMVVRASGRRK